jgi:hypothetical protein
MDWKSSNEPILCWPIVHPFGGQLGRLQDCMRVIGQEGENQSVLCSAEGKHGYVNPGVSHIEGHCASFPKTGEEESRL